MAMESADFGLEEIKELGSNGQGPQEVGGGH